MINQIVINFKVTPKPFLLRFSITCKLKGQKFNQWLRILIPTIIIAMKQNKQSGSKCTTRSPPTDVRVFNIPWRKPMLPERSVRVIDRVIDRSKKCKCYIFWLLIKTLHVAEKGSKQTPLGRKKGVHNLRLLPLKSWMVLSHTGH